MGVTSDKKKYRSVSAGPKGMRLKRSTARTAKHTVHTMHTPITRLTDKRRAVLRCDADKDEVKGEFLQMLLIRQKVGLDCSLDEMMRPDADQPAV